MYQVVRKITDEHAQFDDTKLQLSAAKVYDEIRGSNSSLNRKNKKLLQDSIERVLETIQLDSESDSVIEVEEEHQQDGTSTTNDRTTNRLNRSIVGMWSNSTPQGSSTPNHDAETGQQTKGQARSVPTPRQANGEPPSKKRKAAASSIDRSPPTHVSIADLGGVDHVIEQFKDLLLLPLKRPEIFASSQFKPPRGILLHGPPGCGKTMIANAMAAALNVNFISISAPSVVSGMSGESEKAIREHFDEAKKAAPCLVFIDEIDAITPKRESAQREMEKRIVAQLLTCMDDLAWEKTDGKPVVVIAATNRPDSLDPALRRAGRFDKEINMSIPNEPVREQILRALTRKIQLAENVDFKLLAKRTPGYVGADLDDLVSTAGAAALKRILDTLEAGSSASTMDLDQTSAAAPPSSTISPTAASFLRLVHYLETSPASLTDLQTTGTTTTNPPTLSQTDFLTALPKVQPSALREGFATIPSTTFDDIGALSHHRAELTATIINSILHPTLYASLGITSPPGLLLWGPPGCGKTLLARAIANESRANFISVKGPELLNKYVGESERAVRQVFVRARSSVPVIVFFDELDALVPRRDSSAGSEASGRVVNTLLTELDGVDRRSKEGIYLVAATNRPDIIDPAMLRPGRLDTMLYVGLPTAAERADIFRALCRRRPGGTGDTDPSALPTHHSEIFTPALSALISSPACQGYSGADLESLLRRAGYAAIRRGGATLELPDFQAAIAEVPRSVSAAEVERYEGLREKWTRNGNRG